MALLIAGGLSALLATAAGLLLARSRSALSASWRHSLGVTLLLVMHTLLIPAVCHTMITLMTAPGPSRPENIHAGLLPLVSILLAVWAGGAAARCLLLWQRIRPWLTLACATTTGAAQQHAIGAQSLLNLQQLGPLPPVRLADVPLPGLFGCPGALVIFFPRQLWYSLNPQRRRALLAHEIAHYLRGDHWVRLLESTAAIVYWWLPAVCRIRAEIEEAEEACCDAWVIGTAGCHPREYGEAILDALSWRLTDYSPTGRTRRTGSHDAAPEAFQLLRQRLVLLMTQPVRSSHVRWHQQLLGGGLAAVAAGGLAVGLFAGWPVSEPFTIELVVDVEPLAAPVEAPLVRSLSGADLIAELSTEAVTEGGILTPQSGQPAG
jgi:beta-lactamase regulating signal transducer with metallopeptidase domain